MPADSFPFYIKRPSATICEVIVLFTRGHVRKMSVKRSEILAGYLRKLKAGKMRNFYIYVGVVETFATSQNCRNFYLALAGFVAFGKGLQRCFIIYY